MKFIPPLEISAKIMTLIEEAEKEIILVSPYVSISGWTKMKKCLERAVKRDVKITFFARENATQDLSFIKQIGIELILVRDLHAKLYLNENYGIITSQNISQYSDTNSIDVGYVTEKTSERKELVDFVNKYIRSTEPYKNKTSEKSISKSEVEKIELTTAQLEHLHQGLISAFPKFYFKKTSTYIFCGDVLGFADVMVDRELIIKIRKNLKSFEQRLKQIESIDFNAKNNYKIEIKSSHKSYCYLTFIPEDTMQFNDVVKGFIEIIDKILRNSN